MAGGGILAPGNSPGTLTIGGQLQLANTSILNYEFGQANTPGGAFNDLINVGGDLQLDGIINVGVSTGGTFGPGIYRIFNYGGTLTDNDLDLGSMPPGSSLVVQTAINHQVNLINMAGLDLNFWDGDAGPKLDASVDGGDGTWHMAGADNNWTELTGSLNEAYQSGSFAIFGGAAGTVTVDNSLGAVSASGMQFATDGYLIQGGDIALVGAQSTIVVGDGTAPGAGYTATIASRLTGTSELVKTDLGTLVLTAANSYTGATSVMGGTLTVNGSIANSTVSVHNGATLSGSGTVGATTVASGGTIAPGNGVGTLSVNGDYTQQTGSTYRVELDPTTSDSDRVAVSGQANLASGATVHVIKTVNVPYRVGSRYTILTAAGGLHGTFGLTGDTDLTAFIRLTDDYDANNAYLVTEQSRDIGSVGSTPNQIATGTGVDSLPDADPVKTAVLNLPDVAAANDALDQLSGEIHASVKTTAMENSHVVRDAASDRMREAFCGVATKTERHRKETDTDGRRRLPADCGIAPDRLTAWGQAFGSWGHTDGDGNAARLDRSTGGFIAGVDAAVFDTWRLGILGGYGSGSSRVGDRNSSAKSDEYYLGIYGGTQSGPLGLRAGATYTWQDIGTKRSVNFDGFNDSLAADYHAGMAQVFGDLGYRIDMDEVAVEPFANLAYVNLDTDGFTERGGAAALSSPGNTTETVFTTFGARGSTAFDLGGTDVLARGSIGWRHAFADTTPISSHAFDGGTLFDIAGVPIARNAAVINVGLDFTISPDAMLGLSYGGQFSDGAVDQSVRGTFSLTF